MKQALKSTFEDILKQVDVVEEEIKSRRKRNEERSGELDRREASIAGREGHVQEIVDKVKESFQDKLAALNLRITKLEEELYTASSSRNTLTTENHKLKKTLTTAGVAFPK